MYANTQLLKSSIVHRIKICAFEGNKTRSGDDVAR